MIALGGRFCLVLRQSALTTTKLLASKHGALFHSKAQMLSASDLSGQSFVTPPGHANFQMLAEEERAHRKMRPS
jgi:hypothetical protein